MRTVFDKMNPDDRMRFLDELPEEAWRRLMDELSNAEPADGIGQHRSEFAGEPPQVPPPQEAIVEARRIEKRFPQPDGNEIQIIGT